MKLCLRLSTAIVCLTLASCVGIPSGSPIVNRPLSSEEQRMVGTWTDWVDVPGHGLSRAVIQRAPNHSAVLTIADGVGDRVYQRHVILWEVVNGKLHESGGLEGDSYADYLFVGPNYLETKVPERLRSEWCRFSSSPAVNLAEVLSHPMISVAEAMGSYSRPQTEENPWLKMATDYATKGTVPEGWQKREAPKCEICGATIWDHVLGSSTRCSQHRDGFGKIYTR